MSTRKERLANKRAEQAQARLEKKKEQKQEDVSASLDADISQLRQQIKELEAKATKFTTSQTVGGDVRWDAEQQSFIGHNSEHLSSLYHNRFGKTWNTLHTRLENLVNKKYPGRKAELERKKQENAEKQRGWTMAASLVLKDEASFEKAAAPDQGWLGGRGKAADDTKTSEPANAKKKQGVETILRKSVGWVLKAKPFVRCYHFVDGIDMACDCITDGPTRESSTTHELSDRAKALLAKGQLIIQDGMAHAQRALASAGYRANPFGFAGAILRSDVYRVGLGSLD